MKSQELIGLLQLERRKEKTTLRQQIAYRYQAEEVMANEHIFKIETVSCSYDVGTGSVEWRDSNLTYSSAVPISRCCGHLLSPQR